MNWPGATFFLLAAGAAGVVLGTDRFPPPENHLTAMLVTVEDIEGLRQREETVPPDAERSEPVILEEAELEDPGLDEEETPAARTREELLRDLTERVTEFERAIARAADADAALDGSAAAVAALSARTEQLSNSANALAANQERTPEEIQALETTRRVLERDVDIRLRMMGAVGDSAGAASSGHSSEIARAAIDIRAEIAKLRDPNDLPTNDSAQLTSLAERVDAAVKRDREHRNTRAGGSAAPPAEATADLRKRLDQVESLLGKLLERHR
ncbi:MAG: hypothetical protein V3T86_10030 [Planctomycetota bacterium]